jgi:hypothetical protein
MPPSNDDVYVKHKDMNKLMWSGLAAAGTLLLAIIGGVWSLRTELSVIQTDVAVIKYQIANPHAAVEIDGQRQWQVVFVEVPAGEAELKDQRIRELHRQILATQGD